MDPLKIFYMVTDRGVQNTHLQNDYISSFTYKTTDTLLAYETLVVGLVPSYKGRGVTRGESVIGRFYWGECENINVNTEKNLE